jgi:hypothetical protein
MELYAGKVWSAPDKENDAESLCEASSLRCLHHKVGIHLQIFEYFLEDIRRQLNSVIFCWHWKKSQNGLKLR